MNPLISIIIPTYNWSSALKLAIKTALWQSYQNFEIIVVGDCCTDDSEQIVKSFNDSRIKWFNLEQNSGSQSIPNNFGIEKSKGEYIAHLGHDDVWHPKHLEYLLQYLDQFDFFHSLCVSIGPDNEETKQKNKMMLYGLNTHQNENDDMFFVPPSCFMYKRSLYEKVGAWKHYKEIYNNPDVDFVLRCFKKSIGKVFCSNKLTSFKFNSAWRKDSYIIKPTHQQELFINKLIKNEDFFNKAIIELAGHYKSLIGWQNADSSTFDCALFILQNYFIIHPMTAFRMKEIETSDKPKGFGVTEARIYRGLEK